MIGSAMLAGRSNRDGQVMMQVAPSVLPTMIATDLAKPLRVRAPDDSRYGRSRSFIVLVLSGAPHRGRRGVVRMDLSNQHPSLGFSPQLRFVDHLNILTNGWVLYCERREYVIEAISHHESLARRIIAGEC